MPWQKTRADRERDAKVYGNPEYRRNRQLVLGRAAGRCELCGKRAQLEVDHIIPRIKGGGHAVANLRALCTSCHAAKTAQEGKGARRKGADPKPTPRTVW